MTAPSASTEKSREIAQTFLAALTGGDTAGLLALFHDDATWTLLGHTEELSVCRRYRKDEIVGLLGAVASAIVTFHGMTIDTVMADADRAVITMHPRGANASGMAYDNRVLMLLHIKDGKIRALDEYLDTLHLKQIMGA